MQNKPRLIKTAKTEFAINQAAKAGFFPLVKPVLPSPEISSKFCLLQNRHTGEIKVIGDLRGAGGGEDWTTVIDWTDYYPHVFPEPFAAYLIPSDIQVGERVFVEELIEDYIGASWNQGDNYRLKSCMAIWDGSDLRIQYDPAKNVRKIVG